MPVKSQFTIDIPSCNVLSYIFPPDETPSNQPLWIDADDTSKSLSPAQLLQWVKRIGLGLDRLGVQRGDVVLTFSPNHIFMSAVWCGVVGSGRVFSGCNPGYGVAGKRSLFNCIANTVDVAGKCFGPHCSQPLETPENL